MGMAKSVLVRTALSGEGRVLRVGWKEIME